jgi:hypothetical protein
MVYVDLALGIFRIHEPRALARPYLQLPPQPYIEESADPYSENEQAGRLAIARLRASLRLAGQPPVSPAKD